MKPKQYDPIGKLKLIAMLIIAGAVLVVWTLFVGGDL